MIKKMSYEKHIRKAREAVKGTTGWNRFIAIAHHFDDLEHPHAEYTLNQLASDRVHNPCSDRKFAARVMSEMAYLVATNEELVA